MLYPVSISSAEAFGTASLEFQTIRPPSISLPAPIELRPTGIYSGEFGTTLIGGGLLAESFGGEAFGQTAVKISLLAAAIASAETFGTAQGAPADWSIAVLPVQ